MPRDATATIAECCLEVTASRVGQESRSNVLLLILSLLKGRLLSAALLWLGFRSILLRGGFLWGGLLRSGLWCIDWLVVAVLGHWSGLGLLSFGGLLWSWGWRGLWLVGVLFFDLVLNFGLGLLGSALLRRRRLVHLSIENSQTDKTSVLTSSGSTSSDLTAFLPRAFLAGFSSASSPSSAALRPRFLVGFFSAPSSSSSLPSWKESQYNIGFARLGGTCLLGLRLLLLHAHSGACSWTIHLQVLGVVSRHVGGTEKISLTPFQSSSSTWPCSSARLTFS